MTHEQLLVHRDEALRKASTQGMYTPGWYYWFNAAQGMERLMSPGAKVHKGN
jgi:hypothetical protein